MKRILVKTIFVMVSLAFLAGSSWGAVFCVSTATEFQDALTVAETNGEDDIIKVVRGIYNGNFTYSSDEGKSVTLLGGYAPGCTSRLVDPSNTVLDGGSSGGVLSIDNLNGGNIFIEGFTIQNGDLVNWGGGVDANSISSLGPSGDVIIANNIIKGNTALIGAGGVCGQSFSVEASGNVIFTNNIISGNTAAVRGAGLDAASYSETTTEGDITLTNNTITGNILTEGPGAAVSLYNGDVNVYNNIIWGNDTFFGDIYLWQWLGTSNGYNNDYSKMYGSWTNSGNNINEDPLFVGSGNYHLQPNSPCIDAGTNGAPELPVSDIEGSPRIIDGDGNGTAVVDMGAYESQVLEQIFKMIEDIDSLVDNGLLNYGQANALNKKLEAALKSLEKRNTKAACIQLNAFINQVNAYIKSRRLSPIKGQALIDAANDIINELCG